MNRTVERYEVWCRQVIHHAAVHAIRARKRQTGRVRPFADPELLDAVRDENAQIAMHWVEWRPILDTLNSSEQTVLLLRQAGWTQREIAAILHLSQQSVSRIYRRAIQDVRQELRLHL